MTGRKAVQCNSGCLCFSVFAECQFFSKITHSSEKQQAAIPDFCKTVATLWRCCWISTSSNNLNIKDQALHLTKSVGVYWNLHWKFTGISNKLYGLLFIVEVYWNLHQFWCSEYHNSHSSEGEKTPNLPHVPSYALS